VSGVGSQDEVRVQLQPLADALDRYCEAAARQSADHGHLPVASSRAMAEVALERSWATEQWEQPAINAHSYGVLVCHFLLDHLAALAAMLKGAVVGPSFAHLTVARAIVESAPVGHWLLDSQISLECRIKRSLSYRIESANQSGRQQNVPGAAEHSAAAREAVKAFAGAHGWEVIGSAIGGEDMPKPGSTFSAVAFGQSNPEFDSIVRNLMAATSHGTLYALMQHLSDELDVSEIATIAPLRGIVVDAAHLASISLACYLACAAVVDARMSLMGWTASTRQLAAHDDLRALSKALTDGLRED
jgi:hypothetical protein